MKYFRLTTIQGGLHLAYILLTSILLWSFTNLPAKSTTFRLKFDLALIQPFHSETIYATSSDAPFNGSFTNVLRGKNYFINPDYKFSGGLAFNIQFKQNLRMDLKVFSHNHSSFGRLQFNPTDNRFVFPVLAPQNYFNTGSLNRVVDLNNAESLFSYNVNYIDFTLGQTILSQGLNIQPYMGLDLSKIKIRQTTFYSSVSNSENDLFVKERFAITGAGPLLGTRLNYTILPQVNVVSDFSLAVLLGKGRSVLQTQSTPPSASGPQERIGVEGDLKSRALSHFERLNMMLGLQYQNYLVRYLWGFEVTAGYRFTKYFNAASINVPSSWSNPALVSHLLKDIGFQGPYLSMTLVRN